MHPDITTISTDIFFRSVAEKRKTAHQLFIQYGSLLNNDHKLRQSLLSLRKLSSILSSQMSSMGMTKLCCECGNKDDGGCCSSFMAGETDGILLLINLMLGVDVKVQHDNDIECCYLGRKGCILKVKPVFCLNYNCRKILQGNSADSLALLDKEAGNILRKQVEIEAYILEKLSSVDLG